MIAKDILAGTFVPKGVLEIHGIDALLNKLPGEACLPVYFGKCAAESIADEEPAADSGPLAI